MLGLVRIGLVFALFGAVPARAADAPVIVIPGKAGVPVIINGYDASYTVVEGDWGLDRPGQVPATIVSGPLVTPQQRYYGSYFPAFGRQPGYGRREIEPPANRRLPPPAPSYERFWGADSAPLPATIEPPAVQTESSTDGRDGTDNEPRESRREEPRDTRREQPQETKNKTPHEGKPKEPHEARRKWPHEVKHKGAPVVRRNGRVPTPH